MRKPTRLLLSRLSSRLAASRARRVRRIAHHAIPRIRFGQACALTALLTTAYLVERYDFGRVPPDFVVLDYPAIPSTQYTYYLQSGVWDADEARLSAAQIAVQAQLCTATGGSAHARCLTADPWQGRGRRPLDSLRRGRRRQHGHDQQPCSNRAGCHVAAPVARPAGRFCRAPARDRNLIDRLAPPDGRYGGARSYLWDGRPRQ